MSELEKKDAAELEDEKLDDVAGGSRKHAIADIVRMTAAASNGAPVSPTPPITVPETHQ